ncbi:MAG: nicotinate-nucleotide adenylyltransferase [Gammaproteobacteria bacterium]|nr:nicotinate-nucleotide adenylyltransferase [Gammaproteobacteria bacterium]
MQAILGGTFDPVHRGHLHAAAVGRSLLGAPKVTLMLAARPWHREAPATSIEHRLRMLRLAVGADPHLVVSDWEARREGPSYTVDTLTALADGEPLVWLIGGDAFAAVDSWHRVDDLAALCHFLVLNRPGSRRDERMPKGFRRIDDPSALVRWPSGCVCFAGATMLDVSATRIRRRISSGGAVDGLLTPEVWAYIRTHGLYGRRQPGG